MIQVEPARDLDLRFGSTLIGGHLQQSVLLGRQCISTIECGIRVSLDLIEDVQNSLQGQPLGLQCPQHKSFIRISWASMLAIVHWPSVIDQPLTLLVRLLYDGAESYHKEWMYVFPSSSFCKI